MSFTLPSNKENGFGWYDCTCCPYGYHIDLDFVRYCETIEKHSERTGSIKRRRDRRRQRQSMDMLLGLVPPLLSNVEQNHYKVLKEEESPQLKGDCEFKTQLPLIQDELDDVVSDFERTLQRSKSKLAHNLPDVTAVSDNIRRAPSVSSMTSAPSIAVLPTSADAATGKDFDSVSVESCGLSPIALQNIREQMALSLQRTRQLEDQIAVIPSLQAQLSALKEEKMQLIFQLQKVEASKLNSINANYINPIPSYSRLRSQSLTEVDNKELPPPLPRRDFGVMCGVLTRNVGVGHQNPNTKSVSTTTPTYNEQTDCSDRWYDEKCRFLTGSSYKNFINETKHRSPILVAKGAQTVSREKRNNVSQTLLVKPKETKEAEIQVEEPKKYFANIGVNIGPTYANAAIQKSIKYTSVGVSDHTIVEEFCSKCRIAKKTIGVGPESNVESVAPISLASLANKSKSFNLGTEKLNLSIRNRTIGCQYEASNSHKACQHESTSISKASQHELKVINKFIQYESNAATKTTDTKDLAPLKKNVGCEAKEILDKKITFDVGCNTDELPEKSGRCAKCLLKEKDESKRDKDDTPSRIPRLQIPTTPTEIRKFKRQDTYTKIPALIPISPTGLSGLDLSTKTNEESSPLDKVKQNIKFYDFSTAHSSTSSSSQNGIISSTKETQETLLSLPEITLCNPNTQTQRQKAMPSKEMKGAMKVVNDSLQKSQNKNIKNQVKNATLIIQQEWFNISSSVNADPLDVEDYLDCFEDVSYALLEYIVNMVDKSGNTAMHYAVSHGNFDVVSILLDSKVCDINKQNKAGYTSVMLVSLAEMRSKTHANVVKKLFQLADVNIRAKQHGQTSLMLAVSHGRLDMVQMLLDAGADINIQDEDGSTALMCAAEHGHIEIVKHFLSHPDCDSLLNDVDGSTALKIAMDAGHRHIGVLLYAHERNLHGSKHKKSKSSASLSPKVPSSPSLPIKSVNRALPDKN